MYEETVRRAREQIALSRFRIKETKEGQEAQRTLAMRIDDNKATIQWCDKLLNQLKPLMDDISEYLTKRTKDAKQSFNSAIRAASAVIPDSDPNIKLEMKEGEAWLENSDGNDVSRTEGSGFKGTLSVFLRSRVLLQNPDLLQTLVLDEPFAGVSDENSARLSEILPVLGQDQQIISIEQKKEIYSNLKALTYSFILDGDVTRVIKEESDDVSE